MLHRAKEYIGELSTYVSIHINTSHSLCSKKILDINDLKKKKKKSETWFIFTQTLKNIIKIKISTCVSHLKSYLHKAIIRSKSPEKLLDFVYF